MNRIHFRSINTKENIDILKSVDETYKILPPTLTFYLHRTEWRSVELITKCYCGQREGTYDEYVTSKLLASKSCVCRLRVYHWWVVAATSGKLVAQRRHQPTGKAGVTIKEESQSVGHEV